MAHHPVESDLKEAFAAVRNAQDTRRFHGRRTKKGSKQREEDLDRARERVRKAMIPLRSFLGAAPHLPAEKRELIARVKQASAALQSERRKLWKMQQTKTASPT